MEAYSNLGPNCDVTRMETLNSDILSLKNDTEMVDHSMNRKFSGASYGYGYLLMKYKNKFFHFEGVLLNLLATCELGESFATFIIYACSVLKCFTTFSPCFQ